MYEEYLRFVAARHQVWVRRSAGLPQAEWTDDPILQTRKFTNVFRVLDYGSQFLIKNLASKSPQEDLFRFFLYRHTGRWEAWNYYLLKHGEMPTMGNIAQALTAFKEYRGGSKRSVFTDAYLVFPQSQTPGTDKLESIFNLADRLFNQEHLADRWLDLDEPRDRFMLLRSFKGVGDFMSMQILTDWGYCWGPFRENDFVVAGPGSRKGCQIVFPDRKPEDTIAAVKAMLYIHTLAYGLECPKLDGKQPSLMDIQNTFCEFQKYVRYKGEGKTLPPYTPRHPRLEAPVLPKNR